MRRYSVLSFIGAIVRRKIWGGFIAMNIRLTHIDGKLPNLALMKLSAWHKEQGHIVRLTRKLYRELDEPEYDLVYASTIFQFSAERIAEFRKQFPKAIIGGTGSGNLRMTVEEFTGHFPDTYDYSIYPEYKWSLGFTQRGCRLSCKFCVVPEKEGKPRSINTIYDIWREETERNVCLLDNDFFGQPFWRDRIEEIQEGNFKVCFNQGINVRMITDESAKAIASIKYYDDQFKTKRIYTAWDNAKDETVVMAGLQRLRGAGVKPDNIMVYMLCGYWPGETQADREHRRAKLREFGCRPYPMPFTRTPELVGFQRWIVGAYDKRIPWNVWSANNYRPEGL